MIISADTLGKNLVHGMEFDRITGGGLDIKTHELGYASSKMERKSWER